MEEKLARETSATVTNNEKDNKRHVFIRKEVHTLDCCTKYAPIGSTYSQALECLLSKGMIDLQPIKLVIKNTQKSKNLDLNKYCKYHEGQGHDTEDY